jgi:hypothetical protein
MFDLFANASEGMMLVDRQARVVWINDQYRRYLPALGFDREEDFVGHPVSAVVQNTLMHQVLATGKPILIDLLTNKAGTFVVSRVPLRDTVGTVIGALGIVLFDQPETNLQPLIAKFSLLQRDLDDARRELARHRVFPTGQRQARYTFASFVGSSPAAVEVKRQARRAAQSSLGPSTSTFTRGCLPNFSAACASNVGVAWLAGRLAHSLASSTPLTSACPSATRRCARSEWGMATVTRCNRRLLGLESVVVYW